MECHVQLLLVYFEMRYPKVLSSYLLLLLLALALPAANAAASPGYLLYTQRNPNAPQRIEPTVESLLRTSFYALEPIVLSIPNWQSNSSRAIQETLVPALLAREACNVFAVELAMTQSESEIVESLRDLLILLHQDFGVPLQQQRILAFADGAHLAGAVAEQVQQQLLGEQLAQITALDPSSEASSASTHLLSPQDARFVEVIHTNADALGTITPLGDVDYYPNGGREQPGCTTDTCSHERSLDLAVEMWSKENQFLRAQCSSLEQLSAQSCRWSSQRMGEHGKGIYFLETQGTTPYARGAYYISFL